MHVFNVELHTYMINTCIYVRFGATEKCEMGHTETQLENLHQNLVSALSSEEELAAEVSEYEDETRRPFLSSCQELSTVDMERLKKLV